MSQEIIRKFTEYYENYSLETLDSCDQVYSSELKFIDPFHEIDGRENFVEYSRNLMKNVHECRFDIQHVFRKENEAAVFWKMLVKSPICREGVWVDGSTHLKFDNLIHYHKDYFDSSQLVYKNLPVLGSVIRMIEKRMG